MLSSFRISAVSGYLKNVLKSVEIFLNERVMFLFFDLPETRSLLKRNNLFQNNLDTSHELIGLKGCLDVAL